MPVFWQALVMILLFRTFWTGCRPRAGRQLGILCPARPDTGHQRHRFDHPDDPVHAVRPSDYVRTASQGGQNNQYLHASQRDDPILTVMACSSVACVARSSPAIFCGRAALAVTDPR